MLNKPPEKGGTNCHLRMNAIALLICLSNERLSVGN